jgi:deazaflavin-dependent oxidoreductase (nitroreductase family)
MTQKQQTSSRGSGSGAIARWIQRRANRRTAGRIRRKGGDMMGMDVLILHAVGRCSGQALETPVAWVPDGDDAWLVVASGGGDRHPDWYFNCMAIPERAAVEMHGSEPVPVTPEGLEGASREQAWERIAAAQPRIAKYQAKSRRAYPVLRLTSAPETR